MPLRVWLASTSRMHTARWILANSVSVVRHHVERPITYHGMSLADGWVRRRPRYASRVADADEQRSCIVIAFLHKDRVVTRAWPPDLPADPLRTPRHTTTIPRS